MIRAPRLLSGRIRKSLTCFKWETGQNVALHHMLTLARQENHFFFFFFLMACACLGSSSASQSWFLQLNDLFLCLLLSSHSTGAAAPCRPLHLFRDCTTFCRRSPSWADVGRAFAVERQHLRAPSAAHSCSSEGVVEEEGGGGEVSCQKIWHPLTSVEEELLLHCNLSRKLMHLWVGQFVKLVLS